MQIDVTGSFSNIISLVQEFLRAIWSVDDTIFVFAYPLGEVCTLASFHVGFVCFELTPFLIYSHIMIRGSY